VELDGEEESAILGETDWYAPLFTMLMTGVRIDQDSRRR
jgi:hypothetical protein